MLGLQGPNRPVVVINVQLRLNGSDIHVGRPIGIDGADVAPIDDALVTTGADAGLGEVVGMSLLIAHQGRNNIHAEVAVRTFGLGVLLQHVIKEVGVEDINAHGGQRHIGIARHGGRVFGLFDEFGDEVVIINLHDAQGRGLIAGHRDAGDGKRRAHSDMVQNQSRIIHFIDMVTGEDHHVLGTVVTDNIDILINGIGCALIPMFFVHALLGGEEVNEFIELVAQERPAGLQMAQQTVGLVLGNHAYS